MNGEGVGCVILVLEAGVGARSFECAEDMPRSVANLYFLILALEIRWVKWNTSTLGNGAGISASCVAGKPARIS